jgi:uncharacterized protein (TIGR02596 family)
MERLTSDPLRCKAFSLLELLIVMVIIMLLLGLVVTGPASIKQSLSINSSAQSLRSAMLIAKQEAGSRNLPVEVRFCRTGASVPVRYVQVLVYESNGNKRPLIKPLQYKDEDGIIIDSDATKSSLFASATFRSAATSDPSLPGGVTNYQVAGFFVRPGGATSLPTTNSPTLLVRLERDTATTPINYAMLIIDPFTLRITTYRP